MEAKQLVLEISHDFQTLPYLMASFKEHKNKYRWIANAHHIIFLGIASLITIATMAVLSSFQSWATKMERGYFNFLKVKPSMYWIINSILDLVLNLSPLINDIFVVDISRCYEAIPLSRKDNLLDAIQFMVKTQFQNAKFFTQ